MGGRVLELETDRIYNRGRAEGLEQGIKILIDLYNDRIIDYDTLIDRIGLPEDEVLARLANVAPAKKSG